MLYVPQSDELGDYDLDLADEAELDFNAEPTLEGEHYRFTDTLTLS